MVDDIKIYMALDKITDVFLYLSIIGSGLTVLTYLIFPKLRVFVINLIVYLCISICFAQIFLMIAFKKYDTVMCIPSAILLHYFFLSAFFWTFSIAFNFYQMIVKKNRDCESYFKYYHIVSWCVPLIFIICIATTNGYVRSDGFCYLRPDFPLFLGFLVPGIIIVITNGVLFFMVVREINQTLGKNSLAERQLKFKEFRVYFSIFITLGIAWIFGFIMTFMKEGIAYTIFSILFCLTVPSQGFFIFITFCIKKEVISNYSSLFSKFIPFCKKIESISSSKPTATTQAKTDIEMNLPNNNVEKQKKIIQSKNIIINTNNNESDNNSNSNNNGSDDNTVTNNNDISITINENEENTINLNPTNQTNETI